MSTDKKIEEFYLQMQSDSDFYKSLVEANKKYGFLNDRELLKVKILENVVLVKAKNLGYDFSLNDLIKYEEKAFKFNKNVDKDDLKNIVGGNKRSEKIKCLSLTLDAILDWFVI